MRTPCRNGIVKPNSPSTASRDDLARAALARSLSHQNLANSFTQQFDDQTAEAETLRSAFAKLQQKLQETQSTCEMLVAQHRRGTRRRQGQHRQRPSRMHNTNPAH